MPDRTGIASGTFVIPNSGETSANVWYRVYLTATDSGGLTSTTSVDVLPNTSTVTLSAVPAGARVTLDGQPLTTPASVVSVVGIVRSLGVVSPQSVGGTSYYFQSWSDGGAATHAIATPGADRTYVAAYSAGPSAPTGLRIAVP